MTSRKLRVTSGLIAPLVGRTSPIDEENEGGKSLSVFPFVITSSAKPDRGDTVRLNLRLSGKSRPKEPATEAGADENTSAR
jgi:hypothetical protein